MKKMLATILLLPLALLPCRAQTNVIFGYMADLQMTPTAGTAVTMSLISPNPKLVNGIWVSPQPITHYTDANGFYSFQNVSWGEYEWDIAGQALVGYVGINTQGSNNVIALTTNTYAFVVNGQGVTNFVSTNFWGSSGTTFYYVAGAPLASGTNTSVRLSGGTNHVDVDFSGLDTNGAGTAAALLMSNNIAASGTAANALYANSAGSAALATTAITASNLTAGAALALTNGFVTASITNGLGGIPAGVVTNNQTGVTLSGSFSGNGSGLTNLPASGGITNGSTLTNLTVVNLKLIQPLAFTNLSSLGGAAGQVFAADGSGNVVLSSILTNSTVSGHWQMIGKTNDESLLFTNTSIDRTWGPGLNITPDPINLLMNLSFGGSSAVGGSVALIQSQATNYSVAMMYSTAGGGNSVAMSGGMAMGYGSVAFGGASSSCSALGDNDVCINGFIANGHGNGAVAMGSGAIATNADAFAIFGTAGGASSFAFNGGVALGDRSLAFGYSYATAAGSILFSDLSAATTNNVPSSFMIANTNGIYFKSPFIVRPGSGTTITNGNSKAQWYLTLKLVSAVTGAPAFTIARPNVYTNTLAPLGLVASTTTNTWVWNLNANTVGTVTDVSGTGASVTVVDSHIEQ